MDKEFAESYNTAEWQKKKNRILERDNYTCQICGNTTGVMQVHHITYEHCNGKAYNALNKELITLCKECHSHDDGDHIHFFGGLYKLRVPHRDFPFPIVEDKTEKTSLLREIYDKDVRIGRLEKALEEAKQKLENAREELDKNSVELYILDSMEQARYYAMNGCRVIITIGPDLCGGIQHDENGNIIATEETEMTVQMVPEDWCNASLPEGYFDYHPRTISEVFHRYGKEVRKKEEELCGNTK